MWRLVTFAFSLSIGSYSAPLYVSVPNEIRLLDPYKSKIVQERYIIPLIFQPLFRFGPQGELVPELAQSVTIIPPNLVKIKIQRGQTFSDGSTLTASDVLNSFAPYCDPKESTFGKLVTLSGCTKDSYDPKKPLSIKVIGPYELSFEVLSHPNSFLQEMASIFFYVTKKVKTELLGSGAYTVEKFQSSSVTLKRRKELAGGPEEIIFSYVKEKDLPNAVTNRSVDLASMYLTPTALSIKQEEYQTKFSAPYITKALILNPEKAPFNDKNLRLSLLNTIQNEMKLADCYPKGVLPANGMVPEGIGGHLSDPIPPSKSGGILAGKTRHTVTIHEAIDRKDICEEKKLKEGFAKHNIDLVLKYHTDYQSLVKTYGTNTIDGYVELFVFLGRDASRFFERFTENTTEPYFYQRSRKVTALLKEALSKATTPQRFAIYRTTHQEIMSVGNVIPLYYVGHTNIFRKCIQSESLNQLGQSNVNSFLSLEFLKWPGSCGKK